MRFTTSALFFTLLAVFSTVLSAFALPAMHPRTVFDPRITFPKAGDTFTAGETAIVTWDTSTVPADAPNLGTLSLAFLGPDGLRNFPVDGPLATGFLLTDGHVEVTWPADLASRDTYILILFGDSGNASDEFTILAKAD